MSHVAVNAGIIDADNKYAQTNNLLVAEPSKVSSEKLLFNPSLDEKEIISSERNLNEGNNVAVENLTFYRVLSSTSILCPSLIEEDVFVNEDVDNDVQTLYREAVGVFDYNVFEISKYVCKKLELISDDSLMVLKLFELLGIITKLGYFLSFEESNIYLNLILSRYYRRFAIYGCSSKLLRDNKEYFLQLCKQLCSTTDVNILTMFEILERKLNNGLFSILLFNVGKSDIKYVRYCIRSDMDNLSLYLKLGYISFLKCFSKGEKQKRLKHNNIMIDKYRFKEFNPKFEYFTPNCCFRNNVKGHTLAKLSLQKSLYKTTKLRMNSHALVLVYGNIQHMSFRMLNYFYSHAGLCMYNNVDVDRKPCTVYLNDFIGARVLIINQISVASLVDALKFKHLFKGNNNLWKRVENFMADRAKYSNVDLVDLQNLIDRNIKSNSIHVYQSPVLQGNMSCVGDRHIDDHNNFEPNLMAGKIKVMHYSPQYEHLKNVLTGVGNGPSLPSAVLRLISFIRTMYIEDNPYFQVLHILDFCKLVPSMFEYMQKNFSKLIEYIVTLPILQSGDSPIVEMAATTILGEMGGFFREEGKNITFMLPHIIKEIRVSLVKSTGKSFAESLSEYIMKGVNLIKLAIETGDYNVLVQNLNPTLWAKDSTLLIKLEPIITATDKNPYFDKLLDKKELPSMILVPISMETYADLITEQLVVGSNLLKVFKDRVLVSEISKIMTDLKNHKTLIINKCAGNRYRFCPFAVYLHGTPGVGKSTFSAELARIIANKYGYDIQDGVYTVRPNVNFQDGLDHTKWCINCDDIDTGLHPQVASVENHCQIINAIVNNVPMAVEQADVSMKGKIFLNAVLVLYSSNSDLGRAKEIVGNPEAFYRRFKLRFTMVVKPKFANKFAQLDVDKIKGLAHRDFWDFDIYKGAASVEHPWILIKFRASMNEAVMMFIEEFEKHRLGEISMLQGQRLTEFCKVCYLSPPCCCKPVQLQGSAPSVARMGAIEVTPRWIDFAKHNPDVLQRFNEHHVQIQPLEQDEEELVDVPFPVDPTFVLYEELKLFIKIPQIFPDNFEVFLATNLLLPSCRGEEVRERFFNYKNNSYAIDESGKVRLLSEYNPMLDLSQHERNLITFRRRYEVIKENWASGLKALLLAAAVITPMVMYLTSKSKIAMQDRINNSTGINTTNWNRAAQTYTPGVPLSSPITWSYDEIVAKAAKCSFKMFRTRIGREASTNGIVYDANHVLVNKHFLTSSLEETVSYPPLEPVFPLLVWFTIGSKSYSIQLNETNTVPVANTDIVVIHVPNLVHCDQIRNFVQPTIDVSIHHFTAGIFVSNQKTLPFTKVCRMRTQDGPMLVAEAQQTTVAGDCGGVYIVATDNSCKHWRVAAFHWSLNSIEMHGVEFSKDVIDSYIRTLGGVPQCTISPMDTFVKPNLNYTFHLLPEKSEVLAAKELYGLDLAIYGKLDPPPSGSTIKFKTCKGLLSHEPVLKNLEFEWCGQQDYWRIPLVKLKGLEANNKINYNSSFINSFKTTNEVVPDVNLLHVALFDYLNGMDQLDGSGYNTLSEFQTIRGIQGSYINMVNMKTSVGPPFNKSKVFYIECNDDEALIHPDIYLGIQELEKLIQKGDVVTVCGLCIPKDEPNKPDKFTRIFTSLPYQLNFLMKKYGAPLKAFIRSNPFFFESAVGINMTGLECNQVVEILMKVDPKLTHLLDGDITAMDKSWSGPLFDIVAKAVYMIASYLGLDAKFLYTLVHCLKHIKYCIQGDLFSTFWNPSGNDWTVELNSLLVSIGARVVYYYVQGYVLNDLPKLISSLYDFPVRNFPTLNFRNYTSLINYGDDNLQSVSWKIPNNYFTLWKQLLGLEMANANKETSNVKLVSIGEVQFLKRTFIWNSTLKTYMAALSKKSMIRMLLMKKPSILTGVDHACVSATEFLREAFLHGPEFFKEMSGLIDDIIINNRWSTNRYYMPQSYEYWVLQYMRGTFTSWVEYEPEVVLKNYTNIILQMNNTTNIEQGSSIESRVAEETLNTNQVATFVATDPATVVSVGSTNLYNQNMPQQSLDDFLCRPVEVLVAPISNADGPMTTIVNFDPINLFLSNASVLNKTHNFTLFRSEIQIIFKIAVPPGTYGLYCISAMPFGGVYDSTSSTTLYIENVLQPIHILIDISKCTEGVLQLPWIYERDYAAIPTQNLWLVYLTCLQPIAPGITAGYTSGNITFFANFMEGYQLVVPQFQSKLQNNSALKSMSPKLHSMIGEGKGSKIAGVIKDIAHQAAQLPLIGSIASTVELAAGATQNFLSWLGFTRKSSWRMPIPITMRSITNVANCDVDDPSEVCALSSTNQLSIDPGLIGSVPEDILSNSWLFSKFTLVKVMDWTTSNPARHLIGAVPITPFFHRKNLVTGVRHFTTAGYVGLPFGFWRGSMEYMIIIPVSVFHRGTLQIGWNVANLPIPTDPTNVTFNYIYNVAASENHILKVDYIKSEPMAENVAFCDTDIIQPIGNANGVLYFRVINPLYSMSATASTKIYVFARAGSDMEFGYPRSTIVAEDETGTPFGYSVYTDIVLQSALGDGPTVDQTFNLVEAVNEYPIDLICMGERFESVRMLMQKPCKINSISCPANANTTFLYPYLFYKPGHLYAANLRAPTTYAAYYSAMYVGISASERYKFISNAAGGIITASRTYSTYDSFPSYTDPISFVGSNRGLEFQIPYYYPRKFIHACLESTGIISSRIMINNVMLGAYIPYYSLAPDIKVVGFRQIPGILLYHDPAAVYNVFF